MVEVLSVNDVNFKGEVLESPTPVLVDFWATWCAPCKQMSEIIDSVAPAYKGKVKVVKLNVDEGTNIAAQYGITAVPTLILFKGGKEVKRMVGVVSKQKLEDGLKGIV
ncbi:MAG TPA: thioredoxin [Candidatus Hypogeohydataceae bacterium YC38]|nr:thioredoxin [Candidatus Brocadiales bacterium]